MDVERALQLLAGIMVLLSVALAHFVNPWWILLTAFIGLSLLQSGVSNWCPAMSIMRACGLKGAVRTRDPEPEA